MKHREYYKELLDRELQNFNAQAFIEADPLYVVYGLLDKLGGEQFDLRQVEVGALFVAMIAWGNRKMIKSNGVKLMELMEWRPYDYIMSGKFEEYPNEQCVHRTLFGSAFKEVCRNLVGVYSNYNSLQDYIISNNIVDTNEKSCMGVANGLYIERLAKITAPAKLGSVSGKSACKRLCMYMRWMVRKCSPDLGLWSKIHSSELFAVLDVHVVRQAKEYGLISGSTAGWKSVQQLTLCFKEWCANDPLKYDFVVMLNDLN